MRTVGHHLLGHAADLVQLRHQVALRVEPPRGIDEHNIGAASHGGLARVERDRRGVSTIALCDEADAEPFRPHSQLVHRGRPEGIRGRDQDLLAPIQMQAGQLGDRCGLARAIDANDEHHPGTRACPRIAGLG